MAAQAVLESDPLEQSAQLVAQQDWQEPLVCSVSGGEAVVYSARAPDKLTPNEDAAAVIRVGEHCGVLVVADGLGGERAGHAASGLAVRTVADAVHSVGQEPTHLRTAILDGIETANRMICEMGIGAATTIAVVEINEQHVRPYHVGDSVIVVVGGLGKVKLQTVSHSPVGMAVESGMLNEAEAMHHDERHIVSNFVGSASMRIEIGTPLKLSARDTVMLASDGLCDNLHLDEIVARIRKGRLVTATEQLVAEAQQRMQHPQNGIPHKPDDLTVITFRPNRGRS
ncbi:MAG: protein phosphatase 2C domain-containing protein [Planctomycetaceae bacterium]|nr:protein phosphatase 2C domain-containing protein [Planctomycetaceae bacterium]